MATALETVPPHALILDRYRPIRPLGSGGSGSVWLAQDEETGLEVALKIVTREGKAASRAEREAQAAAKLRHPHCLRAYGFESDARHVYIAYEYVPGRTLRQELRRGFGDEAALEATAQVLDALAFAHASGIVHRDVKPSNVLVAESEELSVRLFDFGLAQLADSETLTATGDVPGTLAYIAPERLAGEPAGPAADVWAVGVLLWEALAGRHPFWQVSPLETGRQIQLGAPSLAEVRPDLPQTVLDAVDRALSVDPDRRPTAADLARRLQGAFTEQQRRSPNVRLTLPDLRPLRRIGPPALAALSAGWAAAALPFYPARWPFLLAGLAAALTAWRPRMGLAFALAVPIFPLGNVSLGLALFYTAVAVVWLAIAWGEPKGGLLFASGPLLAPLGLLGLLPLLLQRVRGAVRRFAYALAGVLIAGLVAGIRGTALPFTGDRPPGSLGLSGEEDPFAVGSGLWALVGTHRPIVLTGLALAAAAAALPYCLRRGELWIAAFSAALLAAPLVLAPEASPWPFVATAWSTFTVLTLQWRLRGGEAGRIPGLDGLSRATRARRVSARWGNLPVPPDPLHSSAMRQAASRAIATRWPQRTALARRR
jgi:hypothetical protein